MTKDLEILKIENRELTKLNNKLISDIEKLSQKYRPLINGKYYLKREDGSLPVMAYVNHVTQVSFLEKLSMMKLEEVTTTTESLLRQERLSYA